MDHSSRGGWALVLGGPPHRHAKPRSLGRLDAAQEVVNPFKKETAPGLVGAAKAQKLDSSRRTRPGLAGSGGRRQTRPRGAQQPSTARARSPGWRHPEAKVTRASSDSSPRSGSLSAEQSAVCGLKDHASKVRGPGTQ